MDDQSIESQAPQAPVVVFRWQASEYVHHHKSASWYAGLGVAILVLVGFAIWLKLWFYIPVFLIMGVALAVYAHKPPRLMSYELSNEGLHINERLYTFDMFRSFSVMPDADWHSIDLEPNLRFSPRVVLLFDPADMDAIVSHLELYLPRADRRPDIIERITRFVRF